MKKNNDFFSNNVVEHIKLLKKHGKLDEREFLEAIDVLSSGSEEGKREYFENQALNIVDIAMNSKPFSLPDETVAGEFNFADAGKGLKVGILRHECHFLIAGQTGSGKSTLLRLIFSQALSHHEVNNEKIISWLFVKAQDMRSLLNANKDILVVNFEGIKLMLNPLQPPEGMSAKAWGSVFEDFWIQIFRLFEASKGFMSEHLSTIYKNYADSGYYPSLHDLYYYIKALKFPPVSRTARYQEGIISRLNLLIKGTLADVFECSKGHINNLINTNVIFEIGHLPSEQQIFLVNYLLTFLFYHKLFNETNTRHFIGLDDSNLIFDASLEKRPELGLPTIHHLLTTVRKTKINIFACTQTPHQLGASIHSNSFGKFMFSLSNGHDLEFMFRSMGIRDEEQKAYCYKLKQREMIVKFSGRYQEPFIALVPEVEL